MRPSMGPIACISSGELVLARVALDPEPYVGDNMSRNTCPLHIRLGTVFP